MFIYLLLTKASILSTKASFTFQSLNNSPKCLVSQVNWLIEQKCNVNAKDRFNGSALQDAVRHGHEGVQKALSKVLP